MNGSKFTENGFKMFKNGSKSTEIVIKMFKTR